eukprot:scaffold173_cov88-Cylindrotheca_fusiformis.AAC.2
MDEAILQRVVLLERARKEISSTSGCADTEVDSGRACSVEDVFAWTTTGSSGKNRLSSAKRRIFSSGSDTPGQNPGGDSGILT